MNGINGAVRFYVPAGLVRRPAFPFAPDQEMVLRTVPYRAVVITPPEYSDLTTIEVPELRL